MGILKDFKHFKETYSPIPPKPNKTYNKFFWWRRYQEHKTLPNNCPVMEKAKNGDYDYSPYWKQVQYEHWFEEQEIKKFKANYTGASENYDWNERQISKLYYARRERLIKDAERDELNRLASLFKDMRKAFGGNEEDLKERFHNFEGTIVEFIEDYKSTRTIPKPKPVPKFKLEN
jgi:hypothetical protein